ncbi:FtsX-like permease family protein [Lentzea albidocapillata subsp. violacea]|uniref:FtsX-like permease family protein n=1 Tax=Lentzea albidocapillata subsp. violacea TaxID=128104 RepID=A0A1G9LH03_9PSEU|nr:FtsX-like permease family protein [Lentzea albidocapillata]SDL61230.1 FtsX-like permease family protein [Lentzea albidocapillata subsp. violacea]
MNRVLSDLALGVRLAVGGSRKSWVRLLLQGAGIGMCVAVLLLAASIPTAFGNRDQRGDARNVVEKGAGAAPLLLENGSVAYRTDYVRGGYVRALVADAPKPPGIERLPGDDEIIVSPRLAELLASPEGELLRPRFPQKVIGTFAPEGMDGPQDLRFLAGDSKIQRNDGNQVYAFGQEYSGGGLPTILLMLSIVGAVVLLFPVLVFVSVATRLAAAQRDRRLAALRLVGAGATRVRLIASGEALAGAVVGLVVGFGLMFAIRPLADDIPLPEAAVFPSDLTPTLPLTFVVVISVPVLAVLTSVFAMRRTIVEPLGVVREQKPVRRRLWWRVVPALAGVALLASQFGKFGGQAKPEEWPIIAGVVLLMFAVPALLPWLVERAVHRMSGATPALQLAVRRLQLDAGTAARVVGGVAVVLAGTVTLQVILAGVENDVKAEDTRSANTNSLSITVNETTPLPDLPDVLARTPGVVGVQSLLRTYATTPDNDYTTIAVGTCAALKTVVDLADCTDGKTYLVPTGNGLGDPKTGDVLRFEETGGTWTVPALERRTGTRLGIFATPAAAANLDLTHAYAEIQAEMDLTRPDVAEHVRNALAPYSWRLHTVFFGQDNSSEVEQVFLAVRRALYGAALITLLLAGASLLVVGLEQVRERRRPLAAMAASGVPRGTLARSLVWQNAIPLVISTAVSVGTGILLGVLVTRTFDAEVHYDWEGIGFVTGISVGLVVLVTALTLPSLRRATGALGLRTE